MYTDRIKKTPKGASKEYLAANGFYEHDFEATTPCQRECMSRFCMTFQLEQEAYLTQHPEIAAMLVQFLSNQIMKSKYHTNFVKEEADFFLRSEEDLDNDVRKLLGLGPKEPYVKPNQPGFTIDDETNLNNDLLKIVGKYNITPPWTVVPTPVPTPDTLSSSFISAITSDTTLPTPEPVTTPPKTLSQHFMEVISNSVDKAIFFHFDEAAVLYDCAYVELSKAVEEAMEIPIQKIKEDIVELFFNAYKIFEINILEKERIAAEIAWGKRMRKKMKKTIRREKNFKGYETPPTTSTSEVSTHPSYNIPPLKPCKCHPQFYYNRYQKDRFGIYLPTKEEYINGNTTVTPVISVESLEEEEDEEENEDGTKRSRSATSRISQSSKVSKVSKVSKK